MLFSSSREDFKRALGFGYFTNEYYANEAADISWDTFQQTLERTAAPLSEVEKLAKEDAMLERDTGKQILMHVDRPPF